MRFVGLWMMRREWTVELMQRVQLYICKEDSRDPGKETGECRWRLGARQRPSHTYSTPTATSKTPGAGPEAARATHTSSRCGIGSPIATGGKAVWLSGSPSCLRMSRGGASRAQHLPCPYLRGPRMETWATRRLIGRSEYPPASLPCQTANCCSRHDLTSWVGERNRTHYLLTSFSRRLLHQPRAGRGWSAVRASPPVFPGCTPGSPAQPGLASSLAREHVSSRRKADGYARASRNPQGLKIRFLGTIWRTGSAYRRDEISSPTTYVRLPRRRRRRTCKHRSSRVWRGLAGWPQLPIPSLPAPFHRGRVASPGKTASPLADRQEGIQCGGRWRRTMAKCCRKKKPS